ncbi:MAG: FtsX-like permease family protein [Promethearchaeota archaeon]
MNIKYALRDLKKQGTRTVLGIIGISVSIFLLTVVGMLGDSISYAYVDFASQSEGKVDYEISGGHINYTWVEQQLTAKAELDVKLRDFLPRDWMTSWGAYQRRAINPANGESIKRVVHLGVNLTREQSALQGAFTYVNGTPYSGALGSNEVIITTEVANALSIGAGEPITYQTIQWETNEWAPGTEVNVWNNTFTVKAVVNHNYKIADYLSYSLISNLEDFNSFWGGGRKPDSCRFLYVNFRVPENFYSTKDIDGTILKIRRVGEDMLNQLGGFYNTNYSQNALWNIYMPRVEILYWTQFVNIGVSIILLFVSILGMVISGVLINGILSTAVEEKIREFGVFRVLGAHRNLPIKLTLTQATILSTLGTGIGIAGGYATVKFVVIKLISSLADFEIATPTAVLSFGTLMLAIGVGLGVSLIVGLAPALKASRISILGAINPYRQESTGTRMVREKSVNLNYILVGSIMSGIAAFVLFIIPQILLTLDLGLIVAVLVILLTTFLLGATLVGLGFLPLVQNLIRKIFTAFAKKTKEIIRISLLRYNRRNISTVIMFSISFAFITLVSTVLNTMSAQNVGEIRNSFGSDLVIDSRSRIISNFNPESGKSVPDQDFAQALMAYQGIEKTSTILSTTNELDIIRGVDYSLTISDRISYKSSDAHPHAIDQNYLDTVFDEYVLFSAGSRQKAFTDLFNGSNTVIISTAVATALHMNLHDVVLLHFQWGDDGDVVVEEFTIVGIADNMAGIPSIQKSAGGGFGGGSLIGGGSDDTSGSNGIVLSQDNYKKYFQLPLGNYYTSKIFIKLGEQYRNDDGSKAVEKQILDQYDDSYIIDTDNSYTSGSFMDSIFGYVNLLFLLILTFAVVISLFGLTSAAYSTILERTREVGVIETLGLKKNNVSKMFIMESEIIMFSSAINGAIVGIILTYLFFWQMDSFSSFPIMSVYSVPWKTIFFELLVAGLACWLSMLKLVKRVQRMELIEIFRKTL